MFARKSWLWQNEVICLLSKQHKKLPKQLGLQQQKNIIFFQIDLKDFSYKIKITKMNPYTFKSEINSFFCERSLILKLNISALS